MKPRARTLPEGNPEGRQTPVPSEPSDLQLHRRLRLRLGRPLSRKSPRLPPLTRRFNEMPRRLANLRRGQHRRAAALQEQQEGQVDAGSQAAAWTAGYGIADSTNLRLDGTDS